MLFVQMNGQCLGGRRKRGETVKEVQESSGYSATRGRGAQASKISIPVVGSRPLTFRPLVTEGLPQRFLFWSPFKSDPQGSLIEVHELWPAVRTSSSFQS